MDGTRVLSGLRRGESFVYHTGDLATDRWLDHDLNRVANVAFRLAKEGTIALVQERISDLNYRYIAQGRV